MADPRVENLAKLLANYSVGVKPGHKVRLSGDLTTRPLMVATYKQIILAGGHPLVNWSDEAMQEILLKEGNDDQLTHIPEPMKVVVETYDAMIQILGSSNTRSLSGVDPARQQMARAAQRDITATLMKRGAAGEFNWVGTMFPTQAYAQEADMSLADYEDFVYGACFADKDDPVAEWNKIHAEQQSLVDWLKGKKEVRVKGPNVDLTLSVEGRSFINSDGHRNMPSGEIFTSPIEDSANGWVRFTYPAIAGGREVEDVSVRLENGRVVEATAKKNEEFLISTLDTDEGARTVGEFAIGTNKGIQKFTKSILYDEKIGGTFHMAFGRGFSEAGGTNESSVHWDMICEMRDGGKIWVDDELFYDSGEFVTN